MVRERSMQRRATSARMIWLSSQVASSSATWVTLVFLWGVACTRTTEVVDSSLPPADRSLSEGFTYVASVRELGDGRLIIADPREQRLVVADLETMTVTQVARQGSGPHEWRNAVPLLPLAADSSLQIDPSSRRWTLFAGTDIVRLLPPDAPVITATGGSARTSDHTGHVYLVAGPPPGSIGVEVRGKSDSVVLIRVTLDSGRVDTVALLRDAPARLHAIADAEGKPQRVAASRPALAVGEEPAVFADGWVAIARLDPYRVDWILPNGQHRLGRPLPYVPRRFDAHERSAYLERNRRSIESLRNAPSPMREVLMSSFTEFPDVYPPFLPLAVLAGGDDLAYVRRADLSDSSKVRYDIVDRSGELVRRLSLRRSERLVTVTRRFVYVVWRDEDEIERVRRHPMWQ